MVPAIPVEQTSNFEKLAYRIEQAVAASGLGRTTLYEEIKAGRLKAVKIAGRRLNPPRRS